MYLEHFGLTEPPFRITPVTVFFFSGANRGEILDALIYSLSEAEGIVKVSGEVGSGKTMLCRMLLERLPENVETIYLANPSVSREEMLYAIADGLGLNIDGERVGVIMRNIQSKLEEKAREGKRIVVLVDEAHAMPLDTLEELRLLYNLQVGNSKLLQIVLFGQPELDAKLEQPNMRQLKDRIVHHFNMQPLSHNILESYLMFRMRAAGYHGPNIFSPISIRLIADTSNGLMRRANILADKSLLAAFVEDTHNIKSRHVRAAIRDSALTPAHSIFSNKLLMGAAIAALVVIGSATWWALDQKTGDRVPSTENIASSVSPPNNLALSLPPAADSVSAKPEVEATHEIPEAVNSTPKIAPEPVPAARSKLTAVKGSFFEQRLAAGKELLEQTSSPSAGTEKIAANIQLFYQGEVKQARIEGFLRRANGLGKLSEIYLLPAKIGSRDGLRVLYGTYPSINAAREAVKELPTRYQEAFATSIHLF